MERVTYNLKKKNQIINICIRILKKEGLVIAPSDTVYGLLVDATNRKAVQKLIAFKNRPPGKPISVFVSDFKMMQEYVRLDARNKEMLIRFFPGPFTVILPSLHKVDNELETERGTLGVRIPDYEFIANLVKSYGVPLTATSANLAGRSPHYSTQSLLHDLPGYKKKLIDLVIDAGKLPRNKPSTIIDLTNSTFKVIRQGDIVLNDKKTFDSKTPTQTKYIARFILKKLLRELRQKPLIFILEGELGVGKTVFIKGIGDFFGLEKIVSPTYVISYEYEIRHAFVKKLVHFDLYNIQEPEEFRYLGIESYLKKETILSFEWGEKAGELLPLLRKKGKIVYVKMKYIDEKNRAIQVNY